MRRLSAATYFWYQPQDGVQDAGFAKARQRFFKSLDTKIGLYRDRHPMAEHLAAEPIDDGNQTDEALRHRNLGDNGCPALTRPHDRQLAQQIRINLVPPSPAWTCSDGGRSTQSPSSSSTRLCHPVQADGASADRKAHGHWGAILMIDDGARPRIILVRTLAFPLGPGQYLGQCRPRQIWKPSCWGQSSLIANAAIARHAAPSSR